MIAPRWISSGNDRLVFVFPNGTLSRKGERLKAQVPPTAGPRLVATNDSVQVQYDDTHVAVVTVLSSWRFGDNVPEHYIATHIWIKRAQGWRLISAQVARVAPAKPPR
jgi:hypothetical protein